MLELGGCERTGVGVEGCQLSWGGMSVKRCLRSYPGSYVEVNIEYKIPRSGNGANSLRRIRLIGTLSSSDFPVRIPDDLESFR